MGQEYLTELFNFQVVHKKQDTVKSGYQMEPTEDGAKALKSYGLHFKTQNKGFVVIAPYTQDSDSSLLKLKNQFVGNEKLSFAVFTTNATFFDISDLPYDSPGEYVYYFNNLNKNARRTKLLLDGCGIKTSERVPLHSQQFSGSIAKDDNGEMITAKVFDCQGNTVAANQYDWEIDEYQNTYTLDLSRMKDGLYTIEYNGEQTTCYCAKASFIRWVPLLILEIFVGSGVPQKYQVVRRKDSFQYIDYKDFSLHFGLNYCYWHYKMIPIKVPQDTVLKVATDQSGYTFTPGQAQINSYLDPVSFTSEQGIDTPNNDLTVSLFQIGSDGAAKKLTSMPKPGEITTKYVTEGEKSYAQVTVYLVYQDGEYLIQEDYEPEDYTCTVTETDGDLTIVFTSKINMSYVDLYYIVVDKLSQQYMRMNKVENIYSMEKIVTRFGFDALEEGDRVVYWFIYQTVDGHQISSSDKYSHRFGISG